MGKEREKSIIAMASPRQFRRWSWGTCMIFNFTDLDSLCFLFFLFRFQFIYNVFSWLKFLLVLSMTPSKSCFVFL